MPPMTRGKNISRNNYLIKQKSDFYQNERRAKRAVGISRPSCPLASARLETQREKARQKKRDQRAKIKSNPATYAIYCQRDRERKQKRRLEGKIKDIGDLSARDQRAKRKYQREAKRVSRSRKKESVDQQVASNERDSSIDLTSAVSQLSLQCDGAKARTSKNVSKQAASSKKRESRKRRRCYTKIDKLKSENVSLRKSNKLLHQRIIRLIKKSEEKSRDRDISPISTVRKFLEDKKTSMTDIKKKLLVAELIRRQYIQTYSEQKSEKVKQILSLSVEGGLVRKYKLINHVRKHYIDVSRERTDEMNIFNHKRAVKNASVFVEKQVVTFLEENSDIDPGKQKYKKINGERVQIRVLQSQLVDLHTKFCSEKGFKLSLSTFCKYRPMNFVAPSLNCRDTCACILHLNFEFLIKSLHVNNVISENSTYPIIRSLVCEIPTINCFLRQCENCKSKQSNFNYENIDLDSEVNIYKWISVREIRVSAKTKKNIEVNITRKELFSVSVEKLIDLFNGDLKIMLTHELRIHHQAKSFKELCKSIDDETLVLTMDWSENALCKLNQEVHRFHFGASRQQISLHTVMMHCHSYIKGYVTASESLRHDASAILAHLIKILSSILHDLPAIDTLHFKSDGPSTQYKNRNLIFLITQSLVLFFPQLNKITYNYSESGHGKSEADGLGGCVKRMADDHVKYGGDIPNFGKFLSVIKNRSKNIHISSVTEEEISKVDKTLPPVIKSINGIRQMFQFTWSVGNRNEVFHNSLNCFSCPPGSKCVHFHQGSLPYESNSHNNLGRMNKTARKRKFEENRSQDGIPVSPSELPSESQSLISPCESLDHPGNHVVLQKKKKTELRNLNDSESITCVSSRKSSRARKTKHFDPNYDFY